MRFWASMPDLERVRGVRDSGMLRGRGRSMRSGLGGSKWVGRDETKRDRR